jgi:hypothetical protein
MSGCTSTAIGEAATPAVRRESSTHRTAATNSSKPRIPMTEANWPAIDDVARSSTTDDERATSDRRAPPARANASRTAGWAATSAPASTAAEKAVVNTTPGSVLSSRDAARARAAAFPPVSIGLAAEASSRPTTAGVHTGDATATGALVASMSQPSLRACSRNLGRDSLASSFFPRRVL